MLYISLMEFNSSNNMSETTCIHISDGRLLGKIATDFNGGSFYSFQRIPYAAPPLGPLRFKPPRPPVPWSGILDATGEGSESLSRNPFTKAIVGSEDCLHLNVYTPQIFRNGEKVQELKAVMFWIHGGLFMNFSGKSDKFGPDFLLAEDVVLVTINYRLGLLGFLTLDSPTLDIDGNTGLKDIVMALKWVKKNIEHFSGDPDNITVFGQSVGAGSAHLLMCSEMTKGLFHKIIMQSGCALHPWMPGKRLGRIVRTSLKLNHLNDRQLLAVLQNFSAEEILHLQYKILMENFMDEGFHTRPYGIVVEKASSKAFLTDLPLNLLRSGHFSQIPMLIGYNSTEGLFLENVIPHTLRNPDEFCDVLAEILLGLDTEDPSTTVIGQKIKEFYLNVEPDTTKEEYREKTVKLFGDFLFVRDIHQAIREHLQKNSKNIYSYIMRLESDLNLMKKLNKNNDPGVGHGDELGYLFSSTSTPTIKEGGIEDIGRRRMVRMWANFAKFGNPTPYADDGLLNVKWEPVTKDSFNVLDIGEKLTMKINPDADRFAFLEHIMSRNVAKL